MRLPGFCGQGRDLGLQASGQGDPTASGYFFVRVPPKNHDVARVNVSLR